MNKKLTLYHRAIMHLYIVKRYVILPLPTTDTEALRLLVPFFMLCRRDDYKINAISSLYTLGKIIPSTWFPLPTLTQSIKNKYAITPFKLHGKELS